MERIELIGKRDIGVDAVQLKQLDALQAEQSQTLLGLCLQVLRPSVYSPAAGPRLGHSCFRRDHEVTRIRVERLADQPFTDLRTVGVSGVDEGDPELDDAAEDTDHLVAVARLAPDTGPRNLHGAIAQAHDREVAADRELAARASGLCREAAHAGTPVSLSPVFA